MIEMILNRVLVKAEDLKRCHRVETPNGVIEIPIEYGDLEKRHAASVTQGVVVSVGPDAYSDYGYKDGKPVKVGDIVQFAKFSGAPVLDPDSPSERLVVLNDEDVIAIIKSKGDSK